MRSPTPIKSAVTRVDTERIMERLNDWWESARIEISVADENKLRLAFLKVFQKIPKADRDKFFKIDPVVVCFSVIGMVESFAVPTAPDEQHGELNIIFLSHDIIKRKNMTDDIAHEMAHIVRGDYKRLRASYEDEKGADELIKKWGFKPRYSKTMLKRFAGKAERRR